MGAPPENDKDAAMNSLREKALERLRKQTERLGALSRRDARQLIEELAAHQIELEMQNEELQRAQTELAESRSRFADLFANPLPLRTINRRCGSAARSISNASR